MTSETSVLLCYLSSSGAYPFLGHLYLREFCNVRFFIHQVDLREFCSIRSPILALPQGSRRHALPHFGPSRILHYMLTHLGLPQGSRRRALPHLGLSLGLMSHGIHTYAHMLVGLDVLAEMLALLDYCQLDYCNLIRYSLR